jgi:hypothetical protein
MKGKTIQAPAVTRLTMVAGVEGDGRALMKFCASRNAPLVLTSWREGGWLG